MDESQLEDLQDAFMSEELHRRVLLLGLLPVFGVVELQDEVAVQGL